MAEPRPHRPGAPAEHPYLEFRDENGRWRAHPLVGADEAHGFVIGRSRACAICLHWDDSVSRSHARVWTSEGRWFIEDLGSNNGTGIDGRPVGATSRLHGGAVVRIGRVDLTLRLPPSRPSSPEETRDLWSLAPRADEGWAPRDTIFLTAAQMRVYDALMAPFRSGTAAAGPPTDAAIARTLSLSEETVRTHLQAIYREYDLVSLAPATPEDDTPKPNAHKRRQLVERALRHPARPLPRRRARHL